MVQEKVAPMESTHAGKGDCSPPPDKHGNTISAQQRGETMAYAAQSLVYSLAANLFEPYVSWYAQKFFSRIFSRNSPTHTAHGTYTQNVVGEFAGDFIGCGTLALAEGLAPQQLHSCTRSMRKVIDPIYTSLADSVFAKDKGQPDCEKHKQEWKLYHERNLARGVIVGVSGLIGNVATQKAMNKELSIGLIFGGKVTSMVLTTTLGLVTRMAFSEQAKGVDTWLSKNVFAPLLDDKKMDGSHIEKLVSKGTSPQPAR